jgi:hypothetical protein
MAEKMILPARHLKVVKMSKKHAKVGESTRRQVAKAWILQLFARIVARQLGVLVNVVGKRVVLFVHDALVDAQLKAKDTRQKEANVIDPLGLEGVAVEKLVLSGKGKTLKLKAVEKVEWEQNGKILEGKKVVSWFLRRADVVLVFLMVKRRDGRSMNGVGRGSHNGQVAKESLQSLGVRFFH